MSGVVMLAHLGHWYVGLPVYLGPVVALAAWLGIGDWRERRRKRSGRADGPPR